MSKNSFKKEIQNRYKGRGNSWVKIHSDAQAFDTLKRYLADIGDDASNFKESIIREGFAWLRFSRVEGDQDNPVCAFEVRFKGSKIDHPENIIKFDDDISKDFSLLGNTPHKLQLEVDPSERKVQKQNQNQNQKSRVEKNKEDADIANQTITMIREASLTKSTSQELKEWNDWLRINNMYEDHAV
jgi:hypothetical protein